MLPLWLGVYALFMGVMLTLGAVDSESVAGDLAYGTLATLSYLGGVVLLLIGSCGGGAPRSSRSSRAPTVC